MAQCSLGALLVAATDKGICSILLGDDPDVLVRDLQDRFPKAKLEPVPGLVKLVDRREIEAADWSLTPGRYVGVAPPEEDDDFDFEQTLRDIHTELADLNKEAAELAAKIQENFEELGA